MLLIAGRTILFSRKQIQTWVEATPDRFLHLLMATTLGSGAVWAFLPFLPDQLGNYSSPSPFIIFVIAGTAGGAVALNPAYALSGLAFAIPAVSALGVRYLFEGDMTSYLFALCCFFYAFILMRSSVSSEQAMLKAIRLGHEKTTLIERLQLANQEAQSAVARLDHLAYRDSLTSLANRAAFTAELSRLVGAPEDQEQSFSLLIIDLDNFKTINDTLGHGAGDMVLVEVAKRLRENLADTDFVARLGGDEFAIILPAGRRGQDKTAAQKASQLLECFAPLMLLEGIPSRIGGSIGIATYPDDASTAEDLLACADVALYDAKDQGRNRLSTFNLGMRQQAQWEHGLARDLHQALADGDLQYFAQPQIELETNLVVGFELLLRWNHAERGWITPPEIISAAHRSHRAEDICMLALETAAKLLDSMADRDYPEMRVAINISPRDMVNFPFADRVNEILNSHDFMPSQLEVEITEEVMLDAIDGGIILADLERSGVRLVVDDFGTGYSSLAYLRELEIDAIKVDKSFIANISSQRGDLVLARAIIGVGQSLGLEVVAEGIETEAQKVLLADLGCDIGQGYLFAKPMPLDKIIGWMETHENQAHLEKPLHPAI